MGNSGMIAGAFSSTSGLADTVLTTNGDILYYNSGRQRLAKGDNDEVLTLKSGLPSWEAASGGGLTKALYASLTFYKGAAQELFFPLCGIDGQGDPNESAVDMIQDAAVTIKRMHVIAITAATSNSSVTLRDDGADSVEVTVTANTAGDYDSGDLSTVIAAGSAVNFEGDMNGSGDLEVAVIVLEGT